MSGVVKDNEVHVTFEDQQKINKFARINARLQDIKDDLAAKKKEMENLEDAENEILMAEDATIPYMIGEVLVHCGPEETGKMLEEAKKQIDRETEVLNTKSEEHKSTLSDLKVQLYAKFGNNINLEAEEE